MKMFSIIIPTYNRADKLKNLLQSLSHVLDDHQIIIVDDQSTDNTKEVATSFAVDYILGSGNGQVEAKETGLEIANGEYIGFLEDDMVVTESFLRPILSAFESGRDIIQSKVVFKDHGLEPIDKDPEYISRYRWNFKNSAKWHWGTTGRYIPFGLESGRFMRRKVVEDVSIGDSNLIGPGFGESISFSFRAQAKGYKTYFEPNSLIYHIGSGQGGSSERYNKNLAGKKCTNYEYYKYHNMMYIHTVFYTKFVPVALIYHLMITTVALVYSSRDFSCIRVVIPGLIKGILTGISQKYQ